MEMDTLTHTHSHFFSCQGIPLWLRESKWTVVNASEKVVNSNELTVPCEGCISITDRSKPLPRRQTEWAGDPLASSQVSREEEETATTASHDSNQWNEEGHTWTGHLQQCGQIWSQDRPGRPASKGKITQFLASLFPSFVFLIPGVLTYRWLTWCSGYLDFQFHNESANNLLNSKCSSFFLQDLENINKWGLNIFRIADHSHQRPLTCVMYAIFQVSANLAVSFRESIQRKVQRNHLRFESELNCFIIHRKEIWWKPSRSQWTRLWPTWWPWRTTTTRTWRTTTACMPPTSHSPHTSSCPPPL